MRVLVCGDREWADPVLIRLLMDGLYPYGTVIHGACRGADTMAGQAAFGASVETEVYPADWDRYGKGAGHIRNQQMLDEGQPDVVVAFHDDIENSRGTADMVRRAKKAGVPTYIVRHA